MTLLKPRYRTPALMALLLTLLAGCPLTPQLEVTPKALTFGSAAITTFLDIINQGAGALHWNIEEVTRADEGSPWVANDVPWLTVTPLAGVATTEIDRIAVTAQRTGRPVGTYNNAGVRIVTDGGEAVVPVSMIVQPTLTVSPSEFSLSPTATFASFVIANVGTSQASWRVRFLDDPDDLGSARDLPADFLVSPNPGSTPAGGTTAVNVQWAAGRTDFYLLVDSDAGSNVVAFRFGAALQGLQVRPDVLTLFIESTEIPEGGSAPAPIPSILRIANTSAISRAWTIQVTSRLNPTQTPPITIAPSAGTTSAGQETQVQVSVNDVTTVSVGSGAYDLFVRSEDRFLVVPIVVEIRSLPVIAISEPPQATSTRPEIVPLTVLDFGREEIQKTFWIANIGPRSSQLYFKITHEDEGSEDPLIVSVKPPQGGANGEDGNAEDFFHPDLTNTLIDGVEITVTIDRSNLKEDVEFHTITVSATDLDFKNPLDAVESQTLQVRAERQPLTVEGAINRSRPPYVMRFVFLLRDTLSQVIPTLTAEDLERISFTVTENEIPLDLDETSLFVTGPADLRVNLVVLLDYTGSMYYAGTADAVDPLAPGEAIEQVKTATKQFLDDLPPSYRVAIMYYNDRQQPDRLIQAFTTDRAALKASLDTFTLPASQHGVSDIRDAVVDAVELLAAEDSDDTLPFDEADVRAVVFITDGNDNSSVATASEVAQQARDARARLYPLAYSPSQNTSTADLLVMAHDTGGHMYAAGNVRNLAGLLGNQKGFALSPSSLEANNQAYFVVENVSETTLTWSASIAPGAPWITRVVPSGGTLAAGGSVSVSAQLSPLLVAPNRTVVGNIALTSNSGAGTATVRMDVGADNSVAQAVAVELRDEPGRVWQELQNQLVLTYITPNQTGGDYSIRVQYRQPDGSSIAGMFEDDAVFFPGEVIAGQLAMRTAGIFEDVTEPDPDLAVRAEVYVRTDYVPRNVNRFRLRFYLDTPSDISQASINALRASAHMEVELAPDGLLTSDDPFAPTWRMLPEGDGIYNLLTSQDNVLPYGSFGNLLKITITGLGPFVQTFVGLPRQPEFFLRMRADNEIYISPAAPGHPSETKYFLYPGGPTFPDRGLSVTTISDVAPPARNGVLLAEPGISPEAAFAWDRDEDGLPDFNDPYPDSDAMPGPVVVPNPLQIDAAVTVADLTVRNNRLDTFSWSLDPASVPAWVSGVSQWSGMVAPGEQQVLQLSVDRTGLLAGFYTANLRLEMMTFATEVVPVTLIVPGK